MTAIERVSYLKGLADGLGLDPENKQDKLISAMIEVLDDFALTISELSDSYDDLCDQVDAIDEDLASVEEDVYDDEYDEDEDDGDDELHDSDFYQVACPSCGDEIYLDEDMIAAGSIECPNCGTELEFDGSCDEECSCGAEKTEKPDENDNKN